MRLNHGARSALLPLLGLIAAVALLPNCSNDGRTELVVYAASSLTEAFPELARSFESDRPDIRVVFNFAGSATLRSQIESGAPADVYAAADTVQMNLAVESGVIDGPTIIIATNALAIVVPGEKPVVRTLADLTSPGVKIVMASAHVPAGAYARQLLTNLDIASAADGLPDYRSLVLANLVSEETSVRDVLAKVVLGEADAGFVYKTDAAGGPNASRIMVIPIPRDLNVAATYLAGRVTGTREREAADAFIRFIASAEGATILGRVGFGLAEPLEASGV